MQKQLQVVDVVNNTSVVIRDKVKNITLAVSVNGEGGEPPFKVSGACQPDCQTMLGDYLPYGHLRENGFTLGEIILAGAADDLYEVADEVFTKLAEMVEVQRRCA